VHVEEQVDFAQTGHGNMDGVTEGVTEGTTEGVTEGTTEGVTEGTTEGAAITAVTKSHSYFLGTLFSHL